ncbi:MAG: hypothetical protein QOF48_861, partial [Verrucomicrobiota bacterium]
QDHGTIGLIDMSSGKQTGSLNGHRSLIQSMAFSPDGARLVTGSLDDVVVLWHLAGHRDIAEYPTPNPVHGLAFSPDGRRLIAGGPGAYQVWEAPDFRPRLITPPPWTNSLSGTLWNRPPVSAQLR